MSTTTNPDTATLSPEEKVYMDKLTTFMLIIPYSEPSHTCCNLLELDRAMNYISRLQMFFAGSFIVLSILENQYFIYLLDIFAFLGIFSCSITLLSLKTKEYKHAYDGYYTSVILVYIYLIMFILYSVFLLMRNYDSKSDNIFFNPNWTLIMLIFICFEVFTVWINFSYTKVLITTNYKIVSTSLNKDNSIVQTDKKISFVPTEDIATDPQHRDKDFERIATSENIV